MSVFYPNFLRERIRRNVERYPWAAAIRDDVVRLAGPWLALSEDRLWSLMFGPALKRAFQVWSNGHCPACRQAVPMYNWQSDPFKMPWKMACPHCREQFPKNDFHAFYRSGLDERSLFDPTRADRRLLFNAEHPDPAHPLHQFGVDDGNGYAEGGKRWWFIGAYLIFGQWKQGIVNGINNLAAAYTVTDDLAYARRAAILLDRVADLFPDFDWKTQGIMYDQPAAADGFVNYWCDSAQEGYPLVLSYDQVADAIPRDPGLVEFLSAKARQHGLSNAKTTPGDIRRNIEDRFLREMQRRREKVHCNFPVAHNLQILIEAVLDRSGNRDAVYRKIGEVLARVVGTDGVTGEKGLACYAAFTLKETARFLALFARLDPEFLPLMLRQQPALKRTYRFHLDTWCLQQQYYPQIGDDHWFGARLADYPALAFTKLPGVLPSMHTFLWQLYEATQDPAYAQLLHHANGRSVDGLPYDLFAEDPGRLGNELSALIREKGPDIGRSSLNLEHWHLAILRSGRGDHERAAWLDYDSGGIHHHADALNLGLFARGLDLMPDFGYPPVQFGGWGTPEAQWYGKTAAHNTVVVDGRDQVGAYAWIEPGRTTLWGQTESVQVVRASVPGAYRIPQYERTVAMIRISEEDFYLVEIFRVFGGGDHAKFMSSHFGALKTTGLKLQPIEPYGHDTLMRNFRADAAPPSGWQADWTIEDRHHYLKTPREIHLRYTDLTEGAVAAVGETWVVPGNAQTGQGTPTTVESVWIPRLMIRRQGAAPLASTFVGVLEPYEGRSRIASIRRLPLTLWCGQPHLDQHVAVEITLTDGRRDLLVAADIENARQGSYPELFEPLWKFKTVGDFFWIRKSAEGRVSRLVKYHNALPIEADDVVLTTDLYGGFLELGFENDRARVISGTALETLEIQSLTIGGRPVPVESL